MIFVAVAIAPSSVARVQISSAKKQKKINGLPLYIIRNLLRYIINTKCCISSRRRRYTPRRDDIQLRGADDIRMYISPWRVIHSMIYQVCDLDKKSRILLIRLFCERAVKRCINVGKNSKKYTGKLLDKLEFVKYFLPDTIQYIPVFRLVQVEYEDCYHPIHIL